MMENVTN